MEVEGRIIRGYAATWDRDQVGDRIERGAFAKTIRERGPRLVNGEIRSKIKVYYNHSHNVGIPIVMREDERGLYVEARIANTRLGDDVLAMCADRTLDAMSFSFDVREDEHLKDERLLKELEVYEFGPVDFPANEAAEILGVKSDTDEDEEDDWEDGESEAYQNDDEDEKSQDEDEEDDESCAIVAKSFDRLQRLLEQYADELEEAC